MSIPIRRESLFLVAVMDRASWTVLLWRVPATTGIDSRVAAVEDAVSRPKIPNADRGCQVTSPQCVGVVRGPYELPSVDSRGRWSKGASFKSPWQWPKNECAYLHGSERKPKLCGRLTFSIRPDNAQRIPSGQNTERLSASITVGPNFGSAGPLGSPKKQDRSPPHPADLPNRHHMEEMPCLTLRVAVSAGPIIRPGTESTQSLRSPKSCVSRRKRT